MSIENHLSWSDLSTELDYGWHGEQMWGVYEIHKAAPIGVKISMEEWYTEP